MTQFIIPRIGNELDDSFSLKQNDVFIQVNPTDLTPSINFLIQNQIAFKVVFQQETRPLPKSEKNVNADPILLVHKLRTNKYEVIVEEIHTKYIANITNQIIPTIEKIATDYGVSVATIKNKFKLRYGKNIYTLYVENKLEYAASLLKKGYTANQAGEAIGYNHPIKFNKMFQKYYGITPYKYKKLHFNIGNI